MTRELNIPFVGYKLLRLLNSQADLSKLASQNIYDSNTFNCLLPLNVF